MIILAFLVSFVSLSKFNAGVAHARARNDSHLATLQNSYTRIFSSKATPICGCNPVLYMKK